MEAITYYLKVNLVFIALFAIYHVALRRETWFHGRRAWLLTAAVLSLLLPLLPPFPSDAVVLAFDLPGAVATLDGVPITRTNWMDRILYTHIGISIVLVIFLMLRCVRAIVGLKRTVVEPSSFFSIIRLPTKSAGDDRAALLRHERVHAEHGHSFDVIAYELLIALFWSNPLWCLALRELRLVHEHTADAIARGSHANYDGLLLAHALGVPSIPLLNTFGSSNLTKRMIMLHNTRSPRLARRKLLFALPALLLATLLASWQAVPDNNSSLRPLKALVFIGVDQQPEFPGGMEALARYLGDNVRYPKSALEVGAEGTVYVGFTVKANGNITDVTVKRGVRTDMDEESLRVVKGMPAWKPGTSKGKAVDAQMTLPISFRLGAEK